VEAREMYAIALKDDDDDASFFNLSEGTKPLFHQGSIRRIGSRQLPNYNNNVNRKF
jgi:hypothetical protein